MAKAGSVYRKVYPSAFRFAEKGWKHFQGHKTVLLRAVDELGKVDHKRMLHVRAVMSSFEALANGDVEKLYKAVPADLILSEMARYGMTAEKHSDAYAQSFKKIYELYQRLTPEQQEVLELAVISHDFGVPFSKGFAHHIEGADVVRELMGETAVTEDVAQLILHHGEYSNLMSTAFPRDIYLMKKSLQPMLLILDICDASGRVGKKNQIINRVGLRAIQYFELLANAQNLTKLEDPVEMFDLRFKFGFALVMFNKEIISADRDAAVMEAFTWIDAREIGDIIEVFGGAYRCYFTDILFAAASSPKEMGHIIAAIYNAAKTAGFTSEAIVNPDIPLNKVFAVDSEGFIKAFKDHIEKKGFVDLFVPDRANNQIIFKASAFYKASI